MTVAAPRYEETGASWLALLLGPGFALAGILFEAVTPGPVFYPMWLGAGLLLTGFTALWVYARKRYAVVLLTPEVLRQGQETLPVARIAAIADEGSIEDLAEAPIEDPAQDTAGDTADSAPEDTAADHAARPRAARVLGGGLAAPRKYDELPLRLDDGTVVLAWARDGQALRAALREVLSA